MEGNLPDAVRDYRLTTRYDGIVTIHAHNDPDAPPSSPPRLEHWKKVRTLSAGAQGSVVLETCVKGGRNFTERAVKKIRLQNYDSKRRYQRELKTIVKFSHDKYSKFFVKSLGWFASASKLYIAMEYFPAGDLYIYVLEHQHLPEDDCRQIASQIISGISLMHAEDFSHRDLKPQNILIHRHPQGDPPGSWWVKLADFGISKRLGTDTNVTEVSIGTPLYMAPELIKRSGDMSCSTNDYRTADVWALGVTVFFILTNAVPFQDKFSTMVYAEDHGKGFPHGPLDACQVSEDGQAFIRDLLRPQPESRLELDAAMHHAWIEALLPCIPILGVDSRPSTLSSRRSSFNNVKGLTTEISILSSRSDLLAQTNKDPFTVKQTEHQKPVKSNSDKMTTEQRFKGGGTEEQTQGPKNESHVMSQDDDSWKQLITAIDSGNIESIEQVLMSGVDHTMSDGKSSGLRRFSKDDAHAEARILLYNKGARKDKKDEEGRTSLARAALLGHEPLTKFLIKKGANLEARDSAYMTPLMLAAMGGRDPVTKVLIENGARIDGKGARGLTALMWAALKGHEPVMKLLIAKGANLEAKNIYGKTALMLAVLNGREPATKLLIEKGADIEVEDNTGYTPLKRAIYKGNKDMVKLLVENGAKKGLSYYTIRFFY